MAMWTRVGAAWRRHTLAELRPRCWSTILISGTGRISCAPISWPPLFSIRTKSIRRTTRLAAAMIMVSAASLTINRTGRGSIPNGWSGHWAWMTITDKSWGFFDINVPRGAKRVVAVLTWDEPEASAGASAGCDLRH